MKIIPNAVSTKLARQTLKLQKNSPSLLFGAGVAGMIGSTVLACKATLELSDTLAQIQTNLDVPRNLVHEGYSDKDRQHDIMVLKVRGAVAVGRLYAPAAGLGILSIAALTKSQHILNERNAAITAAYVALDKGFDEYRARVTERYGADVERELRYGSEEVEEVDEKTGRKKKVTRVASGEPSIYARFFDPLSSSWSKEPEYNRLFLKCQQNWANDMLHARGHVFLNEVYDSLGLERSKAGAVVGWVLSEDSDNFIDFGVFNGERAVDFVNGREGSILLDFNVDGVIFDRIEHGGGGDHMAEGLSNRDVVLVVGGLTIGAGLGFYAAKMKYEQLADEAFNEASQHFEDQVEAIRAAAANHVKPELAEVVNDLGYTSAEQQAINEIAEEEEAEVTRNVFNRTEDEDWDYEVETAKRAALDSGVPYIIHRDEFFENPEEFSQTTITYYSGDDVLADERDEVLEPRDHIVGSENLKMMGSGHGSGDPNVLYIRNERTDCDFEVINNPGKFSEEALGFIEHSAFEPTRRRRQKFDDE